MAPLIEFKDVTKFYGDKIALFGLSFSVEPGSIYGLLGRNGAGKTTALNMLAAMTRPSKGEVRVLGEQPLFLDNQAKAQIAYAGDNQVLLPHLKVKEEYEFSERLEGSFGEKVVMESHSDTARPPMLLVVNTDETYGELFDFKYG